MKFTDYTEKGQRLNILGLLIDAIDDKPLSAANIAVKLDDESYRQHLAHYECDYNCDFKRLKQQVRSTLYKMHLDAEVLRIESSRYGCFGPYRWDVPAEWRNDRAELMELRNAITRFLDRQRTQLEKILSASE